MPRARLISPEFWTSEAVVDCAPMTRLLLLGLSTFADDFGVLPLRPRTLRLQVFPGDALDDDQVCAMIEELAARGLLRRYTVDDVEYLSIIGRASEADEGPAASPPTPDDRKPAQGPFLDPPTSIAADPSSRPDAASDAAAEAAWRDAIEGALRRAWGSDVPADVARHAARWRAGGHDLARDVLPAIDQVVDVAIEFNRPLHLELVDGAMARPTAPAHFA